MIPLETEETEHVAFRGARTPVGCRPARQEPLLLIPLTSFLPCADLLVKKPQHGGLCSPSSLPKHRHPLTLRQMAHIGQPSRTQGGTLLGLPEVMTLPGAPGSPGEDKGSRQMD